MSRPLRERGAESEARRLKELSRAAHWYSVAIAQTQQRLDEYDMAPSSEGDLALLKALKFQKEMMDEYADVFARFLSEGESMNKGCRARPRKRRERVKPKPLVKTAGGI